MARRSKSDSEKKGFRIAVVEESADNIYSIKFVLQSLGYEVASFSATVDFLPDLVEFAPHLIVVDMMIPGEGGYRAIGYIRKSLSKKIPILAITAAAMQGEEDDVIRAGGTDTLAKPYAVGELQERLKAFEEKQR